MKYLNVRPKMKLTPGDLDKLLWPDEEGEGPPTERQPDLTRAWAQHMNDVCDVKSVIEK